jgi:hypothetical protein
MNSLDKKWQSIRKDQAVEILLVQVEIDARRKNFEHFTNLILKQAREVLKDALVESAESRGGKLVSWEDDNGTFLFLNDSPASFNNCCSATLEMMEQLPTVKRKVQLSDDLEQMIVIRIACDSGMATFDPETQSFAGELFDKLKKNWHALSVENEVTITDRIFRQLKNPFQSRFVKWKHSKELGINLYSATETPIKPGLTNTDLPSDPPTPEENQQTPDVLTPNPLTQHSPVSRWSRGLTQALRSRKIQGVGSVVLLSLIIFGFVHFFPRPASPPPVSPQQPPTWPELVQTEEWRNWRKQIHEKLSADNVTESMLAEALKIRPPARPEQAAAALRRDQAVADVLMSYEPVQKILKRRFGIYPNSFLGTGLSIPNTAKDYVAASVHEYLIKNLPDSDEAVWTWKKDPNDPKLMAMTIKEIVESEQDDGKNKSVGQIQKRVSEKDAAKPAVIRFAILNTMIYKRTRSLGRSDSYWVFASNLGEVWNSSIKDAAELSGHTFTDGESLYMWVFVPKHSTQVVPATWYEVLNHVPVWLSDVDKN